MSRHQNDLAISESLSESAIYAPLRQSQEVLQTFFEDAIVPTDPLAMGDHIFQVRSALGPSPRKALPLEDFAARVAEESGMPLRSASTISRWELDTAMPTPAEALAIADLGSVSVRWLIRGEGPKERAAEPTGLEPPHGGAMRKTHRPVMPEAKEQGKRDD